MGLQYAAATSDYRYLWCKIKSTSDYRYLWCNIKSARAVFSQTFNKLDYCSLENFSWRISQEKFSRLQ